MVSCVGQPPIAGTIQRLLRPLMFEMKATCLPSGDHVEPPTMRVMYSFSMEKADMSGTFLLSSLVGSVMASGAASGCCADAAKVIRKMAANRVSFQTRFASFERIGITASYCRWTVDQPRRPGTAFEITAG